MEKNSVDEYILGKEEHVRIILEKVRDIILRNAPEAKEGISYGMPSYKLKGKPLVYFGAQKNHLGFYATPSGHEKFASRLSSYKQGKGSVQFPYSPRIRKGILLTAVEDAPYLLPPTAK